MQSLSQSPTDPAFVQNPYPFYERARAAGPFFHWTDYSLPCTGNAAAVNAIFRDRRFGREVPPELARPVPDHLRAFYAVEAHSMLELEPPRHTRLRALVLRAFTSRRIAALAPEIAELSHRLIDAMPDGGADLLRDFGQKLPVIIIARLLGVPEDMSDDLLRWSNAMVGMYMAGRTRAAEDRADRAAADFASFLRGYVEARRADPRDDLITHLIAAESEGERLTTDELIATCILLLNAGHEATVHTLGNGVKTLLETSTPATALGPDLVEGTVEEILRYDPPLHMFTRWAYEDIEVMGQNFRRGDQIGLLLAAANRDPGVWDKPARFDPSRPVRANASFGAGLHFCVGAPLARLELQIALPILFARLPKLHLAEAPRYGDVYHFHGLTGLAVTY
ncbi:cytochrome P450 [Paragemmobacter straminiformis]|uniref:Cytochrome P450 n=1 Tax=Paragemmobacter straminiformis TaxID=2045119 RepID=A0A842I573_9RHOB|nr:cytochrome P450 [Gemmobacter straminiformis]MBC2835282.1 cytochrome P450 [Gemmobacter straminiformis]